MAITSRHNTITKYSYRNTQFQYAVTYVIITFCALLFLNAYTSSISRQIFYQSKESALVEKCQIASDEIANLDVLNSATITELVTQMESLSISSMIVTDQSGAILYNSDPHSVSTFALLPEIVHAMEAEGWNVFSCHYRSGTLYSRAATPIISYGNIIGSVYMTEFDTTQGALIDSLQYTVLNITLILEALVIIFSLIYANTFSQRIRKILQSMRIIQNGDYSHKVSLGGNDELTVLGKEFNELTDRLNISEQKRRRFISDASHELKTPLASIKLLSDSILQNEMDMETVREFVNNIGDEADRLNRMTSKMLTLTKTDMDTTEESEIIYLAPTIRKVTRMLSAIAAQHHISIELDLAQDTTVLIMEDDLYQIVFNLMENGIKYNCSGGYLRVSLTRENDNAILTVRDTGVGIPEDALKHVFERFYRVDKARSRASGGSGLGLAIVKGIVQRNRGEIHVESTVGEGTAFTVTFPAFDLEVTAE